MLVDSDIIAIMKNKRISWYELYKQLVKSPTGSRRAKDRSAVQDIDG